MIGSVNNFGVDNTTADSAANGGHQNWINNVMSWDLNQMNTNIGLVKSSLLARYCGGNVSLYKCPADKFLSDVQRKAHWSERVRSLSMNAHMGLYGPNWKQSANQWNTTYRQMLKQSDIIEPAKTYVTLDEHPDSINDGFFLLTLPAAGNWGDLPASYHNGAGGFSFSDGHSEIHKWLYPSTKIKVKTTTLGTITYPAQERGDFDWTAERVGPKK